MISTSLSSSESLRLSDDESYIPSWVFYFQDDSDLEFPQRNQYEYVLPDEYEYDELSLYYINNQPPIPWHKRLWKHRIYPCLYYIRWAILREITLYLHSNKLYLKWTKESSCGADCINSVFNRCRLSLWKSNWREFTSSSRRGILVARAFYRRRWWEHLKILVFSARSITVTRARW